MLFKEHCGVQEVNRMLQLFKCECNVGVTDVQVLEEGVETVLCTCPDEKTIVNVSFPKEGLGWVIVNKILLEFDHKGC